ncbi:zeta toxin family protein [Streptomyces hyaluromycini]|uniref:zeta toxin family protein n=1 Tax=Streptomyces hyaluromycini TaxID=1377993 RepID=UPI000B5C3E35|nr:zeta toxin family protein [Streptomyces hyaluromycini]
MDNQDALAWRMAQMRIASERQARQMETRLPNGDLSSRKIQEIFNEQILPTVKLTPPRPRLLLIVGQMGAGKSSAEKPLLDSLGIEDPMSIDGDNLYRYHPMYERMALQDDVKALDLCEPAMQKWASGLQAHALQNRRNVAMPMFYGASNSQMVQYWRSQGYGIDVAFIAVDDLRSKQGVISRYLEARQAVGYGRSAFDDMNGHYYKGVLRVADLADQLLQGKYIDAVHVVRRGGDVLYSSSSPGSGRTRDIIIAERRRPWTGEEKKAFIETQNRIEELGRSYRGGWKELKVFINYVSQRALNERRLSRDVRGILVDGNDAPSMPRMVSDSARLRPPGVPAIPEQLRPSRPVNPYANGTQHESYGNWEPERLREVANAARLHPPGVTSTVDPGSSHSYRPTLPASNHRKSTHTKHRPR